MCELPILDQSLAAAAVAVQREVAAENSWMDVG